MVKERAFYKTLLLLAVPISLKSMLSLGVNLLDNIMVGSLSEVGLSSVALANQVSTLFAFFVNGLGGGAAVLISQYWGKRDVVRIKSVISVVFYLALGTSTLVALFVRCFPEMVMGVFTNEADLIATGAEYLKILCYSYILFALSETMAVMMRNVEIVKVALYTTIGALVINLFFNYALIYGHFGFPAMGVRGAAIATLLARIAEFGVMVTYVFFVQKRFPIKPRELLRGEKVIWLDYLRYGLPVIAGDSQWGLVGMFKATIVGRLGSQMVAANSIAETIMSLASILTVGLGNAACVMIGKAVGAGDYKRARAYSNTMQVLFASCGVIMCTTLFFARHAPVSLYNVQPETAAMAAQFIAIGALTLMGTFYHATSFTGINRGAGDSKFVFKVDMVCGWLIVLPLSLLVAFVLKWPLWAVFLTLRIDQCFKWIIAFIRLRGNKWMRNVTRAEAVEAEA